MPFSGGGDKSIKEDSGLTSGDDREDVLSQCGTEDKTGGFSSAMGCDHRDDREEWLSGGGEEDKTGGFSLAIGGVGGNCGGGGRR